MSFESSLLPEGLGELMREGHHKLSWPALHPKPLEGSPIDPF